MNHLNLLLRSLQFLSLVGECNEWTKMETSGQVRDFLKKIEPRPFEQPDRDTIYDQQAFAKLENHSIEALTLISCPGGLYTTFHIYRDANTDLISRR